MIQNKIKIFDNNIIEKEGIVQNFEINNNNFNLIGKQKKIIDNEIQNQDIINIKGKPILEDWILKNKPIHQLPVELKSIQKPKNWDSLIDVKQNEVCFEEKGKPKWNDLIKIVNDKDFEIKDKKMKIDLCKENQHFELINQKNIEIPLSQKKAWNDINQEQFQFKQSFEGKPKFLNLKIQKNEQTIIPIPKKQVSSEDEIIYNDSEYSNKNSEEEKEPIQQDIIVRITKTQKKEKEKDEDFDVLADVQQRRSVVSKKVDKYIDEKKKVSSKDNKSSKQFKEDEEPKESLKNYKNPPKIRQRPTTENIESLLRKRDTIQNEKLREFKDDKNPFP